MVTKSQTTRPRLALLRNHLKRLEGLRKQSEKAMQLRIRTNNLKGLLGLVSHLPRINQMRVKELRTLVIPSTIQQLRCYESLDLFIKQRIDE
jgi:hypothetical protein